MKFFGFRKLTVSSAELFLHPVEENVESFGKISLLQTFCVK